MGIFSRTRDIIAANVTDLLDKAEDPAKMIRMIILEMEETLVEVRASAARTIADQKEMKRHVGKLEQLQADWTDPGGKIREHVDYPFNGAGSIRITIWLKLHPPKGSALFSFFNPAMGMDDFIGFWELAIRVDDDTRFNTEFEVLC